jgi:hypothetical protein
MVQKESGFWNAVCAYVPEWLGRIYSYSLFKILFITGWCLGNTIVPSAKLEGITNTKFDLTYSSNHFD